MGKLKKKSKAKKKRSKRSSAPTVEEKSVEKLKTNDSKLVEKLLEQADSCINKFEYELAQKFLERALQHQPDNVTALESMGGLLLELGKPDQANDMLLKTIEICPDERHSAYFSLAQLNEGENALKYYRKGVEMIEKLLQNGTTGREEDKEESLLRRDLSSAYCAMGEIYMTDCCFEDDAEEQCRICINRGIEYDSSNPEAYQSLANFMLIKGNREEAKTEIEKSLSLWLPQYKAIADGNVNCDLSNPLQVCPLDYDTRVSTAKILIELEMFEEALDVLDGLTDEDDEVVEVWYLLGWLNYLRGEDYWGNAHYFLKRMTKLEAVTNLGEPDQISHANELLTELGDKYDTDEECTAEGDDVEAVISDSEPEDMEH